MIPLVCGDPCDEKLAAERVDGSGQGASYTCFLFPFAYRPEPDPSPNPAEHCYVPTPRDDSPWTQRRRYFTRETADALFDRAAWFDIPHDDWVQQWVGDWSYRRRFKARLRSGEVEVELAPPQLILFEWHRNGFDKTEHNPFQTGFLLLEAHFPKAQAHPPTLDDLLQFNDRFRYWRPPFATFVDGLRDALGNPLTEDDRPVPLLDLYLVRWLRLLELPLLLDGARLRLFPRSWGEGARQWWLEESPPEQGAVPSTPPPEQCLVYADNRAFTWTCALVEGGSRALQEPVAALYAAGDPCGPEGLGYWVKLLNVDAPSDSPEVNRRTTAFERDWAKDRTYTRWAHFGTLYGFNYHAGAMLAGPIADPPTWLHFREQYLDSALLLLYVRVTLFRFSRELSDITSEARDCLRPRRAQRHWRKRFGELRWKFALFTNLYKFPLISNQQQAIEMYSYARRHLDVDELFQEVEDEIRASHEFLDGSTSSKINRLVFLLTGAGIALVVFQVIAWFFKSPEFGWIARTVRSVKSLIE